MPVKFSFTLATAIFASSLPFKNHARVGLSGMVQNSVTLHASEKAPKMMNTACHAASVSLLTFAIEYARILPNNPLTTFPMNHAPCRSGCSLRLYHMDVTTLNPGATAASHMPRKKRAARRPPALVQAAISMSTTAHAQTDVASVLPTGKRTSRCAIGHEAAR